MTKLLKLGGIIISGITILACGMMTPEQASVETTMEALSTDVPVTLGETIFRDNACNACHSLDGTALVGPSIQGLGERAGSMVEGVSDEAYVRDSIVDPNVYVVEGYSENIMPLVYGETLTDDEIDLLVVYLLEQ